MSEVSSRVSHFGVNFPNHLASGRDECMSHSRTRKILVLYVLCQYVPAIFYFCVVQVWLGGQKRETFLMMFITSFTLCEKWCSHTVQTKYEDISTILVDFMNILANFGRTMNFCAISMPQGAGSTTPYCWPCIVTTWILATPFYVPHLTLILEMKYNISTCIAFHSVDNESESFWSNLNAFIC